MAKKRTGLDALGLDTEVFKEKPKKQKPSKPKPVATPEKKDQSKIEVKKTSIYVPMEAYEQLRELAFSEKGKMHDYYLEGLDLVFKKRGLKSLDELS